MKKTLAMAISAMLCMTAATPTIASAAFWLVDPQNAIYYEKNEAFSEYSSAYDFYMPVGSTEFRPPYVVGEGDDLSGDLIILSRWGVDWTLYTVTDEEYAALEAFLAAEHPTVTLTVTEIEETHSTCHLVYSEPLTFEEEFALAQDIKAATGLEVGFIRPNSSGIIVNRVDAAAVETTTTTAAETTTTTTTTTAGAVQAGEKGAAGMALAAMGAATVAFVMKKKKFG